MKGDRSAFALAILAGLVLAAMTHIVVVLAAPHVASRNAHRRLAGTGAPGSTLVLPRAAPGAQAVPFQDPLVAMAICAFDLTAAPVRVSMPAGQLMSTLSAHGGDGRAFYALTDRAARDGAVEIVLMTRGQLDEAIRNDDEDEPTGDVRVVAPGVEGVAVVRVVARLDSDYPDAAAAAARLACKPDVEP